MIVSIVLPWWLVACLFGFSQSAEARFAGGLSLLVGEEYNDNIFFAAQDETDDFVTMITPRLSFLYEPAGEGSHSLMFEVSPAGQFFANHTQLNNFGKELWGRASYVYPYSPQFTFRVLDHVERSSESRISIAQNLSGGGSGNMGGSVPSGRSGRLGGSFLDDGDLVSSGDRIQNDLEATVRYAYLPTVNFLGSARWEHITFFDEGGRETAVSLEMEGSYQGWRQHNLRARYEISFIRSRDGARDIIHDFELGDDYFSARQIQLTPTLRLYGAVGVAVLTGDNDFRLENKLDVALVKTWPTASWSTGIHRGLTGSFGVAGPSFTTTFFSAFNIALSRRVAGLAGTEFSLFDTDEADFRTFQASVALQYWFSSWLSASLGYSFHWLDPDKRAARSEFFGHGKSQSNSIFVVFSTYFDIWPNQGLSKGTGESWRRGAAAPGYPRLPNQPSPQS